MLTTTYGMLIIYVVSYLIHYTTHTDLIIWVNLMKVKIKLQLKKSYL